MATRFSRRQKVTAYRLEYMAADGSPIEGELFEKVEPAIDYTPAVWFDADTGKPVDSAMAAKLEDLYLGRTKKPNTHIPTATPTTT